MIRFLRGLLTFLPHLIIGISVTLLTLSITDRFNTAMAFINHPMTKGLIAVFCLLSLLNCTVLLVRRMNGPFSGIAVPLVCIILSVAMLLGLFYDFLYPREILFARNFGKNLIIIHTLVTLVGAA